MPQTPEVSQTILENTVSSFFNLLNEQDSFIRNIENKLHSIVDRNAPEKSTDQPPKQEPRDFQQRIVVEINKLQNHNERLERIYKHLSEII